MNETGIRYVLGLMGSRRIGRSGNNITATCPMAPVTHKNGVDTHPSFSMLISEGGNSVGYCFACGFRGTALNMALEWEMRVPGIAQIVRENELCGTVSASTRMPMGWVEAQRRYGEMPERAEFDEDKIVPIGWIPGESRDGKITTVPAYALNRGLTYKTIKELEIGYDESNDAVVFPIHDRRKRLVGYALRSCSDPDWKYRYSYGFKKKWFLYGEDRISKERGSALVLVEGMVDVAMVWQAGLNVMGILGSELSGVQAQKVIDATAIAPKVFLMFDGDKAGDRATSRTFDKLHKKVPFLRMIILPEGRDPGAMSTLEIFEAVKGAM